jgi:hypothetical protein
MKSFNFISVALAVAPLIVVAASRGQAATMTFSATAIEDQAVSWSNNLTFPQFDPSNGTLTSVVFLFTSDVGVAMFPVTNPTNAAVSGTVQATVNFTAKDGSGKINLTGGTPAVSLGVVAGYDDVPANGTGNANGQNSGMSASSPIYTDNVVLTEFTGAGTYSLTAGAADTDIKIASGDATLVGNGNLVKAGLNATVTYTYTAVPEPSTLALLAAGAVGVLGYKVRRKRVAYTQREGAGSAITGRLSTALAQADLRSRLSTCKAVDPLTSGPSRTFKPMDAGFCDKPPIAWRPHSMASTSPVPEPGLAKRRRPQSRFDFGRCPIVRSSAPRRQDRGRRHCMKLCWSTGQDCKSIVLWQRDRLK